MAQCLAPPVRHRYAERRAGSPLLTWTEDPWEVLRKILPTCHNAGDLDIRVFSPFHIFREEVARGDHDREIEYIGIHERDFLEEMGFFEEPPPKEFAYAWAMVLRVRAGKRWIAKWRYGDGDLNLLIQRFMDTHLRLCAAIYSFEFKTDEEVETHEDFHRFNPLPQRCPYNGCLPNLAFMLSETDFFHHMRPKHRTSGSNLIHFMSKQWPHVCVQRGISTIMVRTIKGSMPNMFFLIDMVLIYAVLGNFVIHWGGVRDPVRRQKFFARAGMLQQVSMMTLEGADAAKQMATLYKQLGKFAAKLYVMDLLLLMPTYYRSAIDVFSFGRTARMVEHALDHFRLRTEEIDWRTVMRGGRLDPVTARGVYERAQDCFFRASEIMEEAHRASLNYTFKLRKATFTEITAAVLHKILTDAQQVVQERERGVQLISDPELYDPMHDVVLSPEHAASVMAVAMQIAPRDDGYFAVEWLQLLGMNEYAYEEVCVLYESYEVDIADNRYKKNVELFFRRHPIAAVILHRLCMQIEKFRTRKLVYTSKRTLEKQCTVLMQRYAAHTPGFPESVRQRLGVNYYCECGHWLSPVLTPMADPNERCKETSSLGLSRGGFDPFGQYLCCQRTKRIQCQSPAKSICMVGLYFFLSGTWYGLCTEDGCGMLTTLEPSRFGPDGPVCGTHVPDVHKLPVDQWPSRLVSLHPGGKVLEHHLKQHASIPHPFAAFMCEFCGFRTQRGGGQTQDVYDGNMSPPFFKVFLCNAHYSLLQFNITGTVDRGLMMDILTAAIKNPTKKVKFL